MKLFQLAEELGTTPGDLVDQATALDVEVPSFICVLSDDDAAAIRAGFKKRSSVELADMKSAAAGRLASKAKRARELAAEIVSGETEALQAAIEFARRAQAEAEKRKSHLPSASKAKTKTAASAEATVKTSAAPSPADAAEASSKEYVSPFPSGAAEKHAQNTFLKGLPVRQMQAPRPEFKLKKAVTPLKPALHTAESRAEAGEKTEESLKSPDKKIGKSDILGNSDESKLLKPDKNAAKAQKHQKKAMRAFHPDDDDDDDYNAARKSLRDYTGPARDLHARAGSTPRAWQGTKPAAQTAISSSLKNDIDAKIFRIHGPMVVKDLAAKLGTKPNLIITELMKIGVLASINQVVETKMAVKVAEAHGFSVEHDKTRRSLDNRPIFKDPAADDDIPEDTPQQLKPRPPVVTLLGHVDHGKTSLMDCFRKANVAAEEAGGITQAIGAYAVEVNGQTITFLDTPGHAAFSAMRARGANLTDIAVIIIAADDGIMPQTKEAIRHARNAHVAIMVAINKCDLPQANVERVMRQLQAENLTPEEWGGDTIVCQVSARTGEGVDRLLEMILLQAEILELRANPDRRANGTVIEAKMEPGSGPTASVLVTGGTLKIGDTVLCGEHYGKLRAIVDVSGKRVAKLTPSMAAKIMGLSGVPEAGSEFRVIPSEKRAKELAAEFAESKKLETLGSATQAHSIDEIFKKMDDAERLQLDLILRADVQGSVEAIQNAVSEIKSDKVACKIIHSGTGSITSTDVQRAGNGKAVIIGFNVSAEPGVKSEARHNGVQVRTFRIIYELLDFIQQEMLAILPVEHREVIKGHAEVKQIFVLSRVGTAAGSIVLDGVVNASANVRVIRNKHVIHTGKIASIRHYKDEVKEVSQAQECGIILADFKDFEVNDVMECFAFEELPKSL